MNTHRHSIEQVSKRSDSTANRSASGYEAKRVPHALMGIRSMHGMYGNLAVQRMVQTTMQHGSSLILQRYEDKDVDTVLQSMYGVKLQDKSDPDAEEKVRTILQIAEDTGFFNEVMQMATSGGVLNPEGLYKTMTAFHAKAKPATTGKASSAAKSDEDATQSSKGFIRELLFAFEQIKQGNKVQFGTMKPDHLVDALDRSGKKAEAEAMDKDDSLSLGYEWGGDTAVWGAGGVETRQHKVIEGKDAETVSRELIKAVKQLEGQNGEVAIKDSVRIADLVLMPNNEVNGMDIETIGKLIEKVLKENTFRKQPLYAFVDSVQITTGDAGQLDFSINRSSGDVGTPSQGKASAVVKELIARDPATKPAPAKKPVKKQAEKKPVEDYIAELKKQTEQLDDQEMDDPKEMQERIELLANVTKGLEERKQSDLSAQNGVKKALEGIRQIKGERGKWLGARKKEAKTVEDWEQEEKASAEKLKEHEETVKKEEEIWEKGHAEESGWIAAAAKRKLALEARMKVVKEEIQSQESAKKSRSEFIDEQVKLALQVKYPKEYEERKIADLDERWRTEDHANYMSEMEKFRKMWESSHEEDGMAKKALEGDERERKGTGKNKRLNEKKSANRLEAQKIIEAVKKEQGQLFSAVEAIVGSKEEATNTLAIQIDKIKKDTGNRKAVARLMNDVAAELHLAWGYEQSKKLDSAHLKKFTEDLCRGGEYVNFQGNLAELRHANAAAANLSTDAKTPVIIGTENWDQDKDKAEGKPQEVDVSYIDENGILHLREVAWDINTLEDKLFGEKKKAQREGYEALIAKQKSKSDMKGVQMAYVLESVSESDKDLIFTKIPKGQTGNRGGMAKYLIAKDISLYIKGVLYTPSRLQSELDAKASY